MDNRSGCQNSKLEWRGPLEFKGEHEFMKTMKTSPKHRPRARTTKNFVETSPEVVTKRCFRRPYHGYYLKTKMGGGGLCTHTVFGET